MRVDGNVASGVLVQKRAGKSAENLELMLLLCEKRARTPFYAVRRMVDWLEKQGCTANAKRVRRLMRQRAGDVTDVELAGIRVERVHAPPGDGLQERSGLHGPSR